MVSCAERERRRRRGDRIARGLEVLLIGAVLASLYAVFQLW